MVHVAPNFSVIAHRGFSSIAPENTVAAFDAALGAGFKHFETDVQLTADGAVVVLHDENLGRTNDGSGKVAECTAAQLMLLDAGGWFGEEWAGQCRIPLLADILARWGLRWLRCCENAD